MSLEAWAIEVAVFVPLRKTFHYLPPADASSNGIIAGCLVRVPFGRGVRAGVVLAPVSIEVAGERQLKAIIEVIDPVPVIAPELMRLARWARGRAPRWPSRSGGTTMGSRRCRRGW